MGLFVESYSIPNNVWKFFENQMEQNAGMFHNNYQKQDSQKMLRNIDMVCMLDNLISVQTNNI